MFNSREITGDWLDRCREKGWTRDTKLVASPQFEPLKQKLLSLGGSAACIWDESDYHEIMTRGEPFEGSGAVMRRGEDRACHQNSARLWLSEHREGFALCTGWALSDDGMWRQHSWGLKDGRVVETTEPRVGYFGFIMTDNEARNFASRL